TASTELYSLSLHDALPICAAWECAGVATQFTSTDRLEAVSSAIDAFIKGIRHSEVELQFRYLIDHATAEVLKERRASVDVKCVRSEEHTSELQSPDHLVCR